MTSKTVIIANRRRESDYWEGYAARDELEVKEWIGYYHSIGQIAKVFPSISEFRSHCRQLPEKPQTTQNSLK